MLFIPPAVIAPPPTVPKVDLVRYMGVWHEAARLPNPFQKACRETTATYTLTGDGRFRVLNACLTDQGTRKEAKGRAHIVDRATGSKAKVTFFWPFYGDYWVLDLDPDYAWALVGTPDRKYLWVLSRAPRLEPVVLEGILQKAKALGYNLTNLIRA